MSEIATLDGLEGARSCLVVKPGKGGVCRCARFGPPGEGQEFKKLCKLKGLPISIGGTKENTNMGRSLSLPPPLDMGPMGDDDMDGIFGIDGLLDPEMLREQLACAGGGAGAAVAWSLAVTLIKPKKDGVATALFDTPLKRGGLAALLAIVSGRALWNVQRDAAKGAVGAMGGVIGVEIATALMAKINAPAAVNGLSDAYDIETHSAMQGLSQTLPEESMLLEQVDVAERKRGQFMGLGQAAVIEPQNFAADIGSWLT